MELEDLTTGNGVLTSLNDNKVNKDANKTDCEANFICESNDWCNNIFLQFTRKRVIGALLLIGCIAVIEAVLRTQIDWDCKTVLPLLTGYIGDSNSTYNNSTQ